MNNLMPSELKKYLFLLLLLVLAMPQVVSAHVLKTDGNIGAVLHIDPDDDPIALSQSGFFFEFKDKQNRFTPENCDCTFSITEDGKEIYTQSLFASNPNPSLQSASVFYTFPEKNIYQVKVVGKASPPGAFQSFTLVWDVRVAREANLSTSNNPSWLTQHLPHLIAGIIVGLFLLFAIIKQIRKA